jgi:hypothetical protein
MNTPDSDPVVEPRITRRSGKRKLSYLQRMDAETVIPKLAQIKSLLKESFPLLSMRVANIEQELDLQLRELDE